MVEPIVKDPFFEKKVKVKIFGKWLKLPDQRGIALPEDLLESVSLFDGEFPLAEDPLSRDPNYKNFTVGYGHFKLQIYGKHQPGYAKILFENRYEELGKAGKSLTAERGISEISMYSHAFRHTEEIAEKLLKTAVKLDNGGTVWVIFKLLEHVRPKQFVGVPEKAIVVLARTCVSSDPRSLHFENVPGTWSANQLAAFMLATGKTPDKDDLAKKSNKVLVRS